VGRAPSELPLHADSGIRHAAVHVFPDSEHERGAHGARKRRSEIVVLDLSLTRLGDLWITIQRTGDACICRIQADSHVAIAALDERRQELAEALRDAGFDATVTTGPWTGDRLLEAARLMERSRGFAISG